jgi:type II secretory pathway component PulF
MEDRNPEQSTSPPLQERWQSVWNARSELATELEQMANDLPGQGRKQLRLLSKWFRGSAKLEDALLRPDVLAISMPLLKAESTPAGDRINIDHAMRMGFCSLGRNVSISRRLIRTMLYPILVLLACFAVGILFSFFIAPQFEEMFAEFGIELPKLTLAVFGFGQFIRRWWWAVLMMLTCAVTIFWILSRTGTGNRPANLSWLDQRLMSTRNALASWAWHISLLLEAGVPQREAMEAAGRATGNQHLRQVSLARAALSDAEESVTDQPYFDSPKYRLLDQAMRVATSTGKIALLQEVAAYYWDRNRSIGDWWIQWLVSAILFMAGVLILLGVLALFMPLIAIVSGLTGGKA